MRISSNGSRAHIPALATAFIIALFCLAPALALDPPHNASPGPENCNDCHDTHAAAGFFGINQQYIQDLCAACHDGVTATQVETHQNPTKGTWMGRDYDGNGQDIVCIDCHDPHTQESALGQNFVGFKQGGGTGNNILRETPGGERVIVYDSTGARASYIKNNPNNGICEVCHSVTTTFTFGSDTDSHYGNASSQACIACHDHTAAWAPIGGDCVGCHSQTQGARRQITDDPNTPGEFGTAFNSHHVNDGTGDEIVTKWECSVCHAEGNVLTGEPDPNRHQKDGVQLKNVDTGAVFADWPTLTAAQRSQFCMSCHDSNGATSITSRTDPNAPAAATATNPFGDGLTNAHDPNGFDLSPAPHSRGAVIDVKGQFDPNNTSHHAVRGPAYDPNVYDPNAPFGSVIDDAIQGVRTDLNWTSTLNCEDCHYGTAGAKLNGHGTQNARYMLRDKDGGDTLATAANVICYRCHNPSDGISIYPDHDNSQHIDDSRNLYGISCLNCHGGGTWGGIHGVNDPVTDDEGGGSYNPNVFTYGASLDLMTNWTSWANNGVTCSAIDVDSKLSDCTQHSSKNWKRLQTSAARDYRDP
jgi:predicted CXXCH cytochrome family protein